MLETATNTEIALDYARAHALRSEMFRAAVTALIHAFKPKRAAQTAQPLNCECPA